MLDPSDGDKRQDMTRNHLTALLGLALAALPGKATAETDESTRLRALEAEFMKVTAERGFDGFMSYFADDASDLPNGGAIVTGRENIRKALGPWGPDVSLTWTPVKAEMAASGELGYTFGNYVFKAKDKDGNLVVRHGNTPPCGRNRRAGAGKWPWTWGTPARTTAESLNRRGSTETWNLLSVRCDRGG
jgi:ketosteroid isomerase-like protein